MSIHEGHRKRLKDRFLTEGLDNFQEVNVLELLLFYCIPRIDTNPIAHKLLEEFGSLPNVMEASVEDLQKVEGLGKNAAAFLSLINSTNRYYRTKKAEGARVLSKPEHYINLLEPKFTGRKNEIVFLLCLNAKSEYICCKAISEGTATGASISVRKVVEVALAANASSVVIAHNHPTGSALPSKEDEQITRRLAKALSEVDVVLVDHVLFSDTDCTSFAQSSNYSVSDY